MNLIVNINSLQYLYDYMSLGVNHIIIGTPYFSCRQALTLDYSQIEELQKQYPQLHLYVLVNALVEQSQVKQLEAHLKQLHDLDVEGIIFHDFGVFEICLDNQYTFQLFYNPETLNTNHMTLSLYQQMGLHGAFLAREIPLEEKKKIAQNVDMKTMVQIHGVEYMASSKRRLLSHYQKVTNLDFDVLKEDNMMIQANQVDGRCHIYEDQYGCHIQSEDQMCALDVLDQFQDFDFLFIDGQYISDNHLLEIVHLYVQALQALKDHTYGKESIELMNLLYRLTPQTHYYHSFLFDSTVYKISDVRKREDDEKHKSNH